jgi:maltose O-acetyltransferase
MMVQSLLPSTRFMAWRTRLLRLAGYNVARTARVCVGLDVKIGGMLNVGERSWLGHDLTMIGGLADITIGADVDIGPQVLLVTGTHVQGARGERAASEGLSKAITIEDNVWIGARVVIVGGVTIGSGAIVGAGAVVTRNVPAEHLAVGVPAHAVPRQFQD